MKRNNGTRIVVKALTDKGSDALLIQKNDELELRAKFKGVPSWRVPMKYRAFMKTVSAYIPKEGKPKEHHILGFSSMTPQHKAQMYTGIKLSFIENGCDLSDFEVLFEDD